MTVETTIGVSEDTREALFERKASSKESYDKLLRRLMEEAERSP